MAFNPFHWFRKRQKVFLAALVVLCMVIFIFQFGQGDLFTRALGWFGQTRRSGDVVTTLHGKKLYESELEALGQRRKLASDFLFHEVYQAQRQALEELLKGPLKASSDEGDGGPLLHAHDIARSWQQRINDGLRRELDPPDRRTGRGGNTFLGLLSELRENLRTVEELASREAIRKNKDQVEALDRLTRILGFQVYLLTRSQGDFVRIFRAGRVLAPEEYYFGGTRRVDDLLDFLVMRQQADALGIKLTDDDVLKAVVHEAAGVSLFDGTRFAREKRVQEFLQNNRISQTQSPKELLDALRDEFRVAIAQEMLLGNVVSFLPPVDRAYRPLEPAFEQEPGTYFIPSVLGSRAYRGLLKAAGSTAVATPDEFLNYVREQRTTLRVKLLPVPASNFLAQVTQTPSDEELRARFNQFRKVEPSPFSRDPGFKEPRRIAVEGLVLNLNDPRWQQQGRQVRLASQALAPIGSGPLGAALMVVAGDPIRHEYHDGYLDNVATWLPLRPALPFARPGQDKASRQLHLSSQLDPVVLGRAVFGLAPMGQGLGQLPAALGTWFSSAGIVEERHAQSLYATAFLGLADPQSLLSVAGLLAAKYPRPVAFETLRPLIVAKQDEAWGHAAAKKAMSRLRDDLDKSIAQRAQDRIDKALEQHDARPFALGPWARLADDLGRWAGLTREQRQRELIDQAVKEYNLQRFALARPTSQVDLREHVERGESLGLEPMRRAHYREMLETRRIFTEDIDDLPGDMRAQREQFRRQFTPSADTFTRRLYASKGLYKLDSTSGRLDDSPTSPPSSELIVYWLTADQPANDNRSFTEAKADVLASWRLEKARALAQKKAEALEGQINSQNLSPEDAERLLREQPGTIFTLDNVVPLVLPEEANPQSKINYKPYTVPEGKRDQLPYPPPDLARQLQVLKRPGDAVVIADLPTNTYYVAVLFDRNEPTIQQFRDLYTNTPDTDPLYTRLLEKRSYELRQAMLIQLRRDSKAELESNGRFKVPAEVRTRDLGRREE